MLHISPEEETALASNQEFSFKGAVIDCLRGPSARLDHSLDFETLKKTLIARHADKFSAADAPATGLLFQKISLTSEEEDRLYQRLKKLLKRNSTMFTRCAKTYKLKGQSKITTTKR